MKTYEIILIVAMVVAIVVFWLINDRLNLSDPVDLEKKRFRIIFSSGLIGGIVGAGIMYGIENHNYWFPLVMFAVMVLNGALIRKHQQYKFGNK